MDRKPNFKSKKAYKAWNAYGHWSKVFEKTPGHQSVSIKGKPYKPKHKKRLRGIFRMKQKLG